ncbi:hypothetical protein NUSPORA_02142 [Nucleospora cyclopteri]
MKLMLALPKKSHKNTILRDEDLETAILSIKESFLNIKKACEDRNSEIFPSLEVKNVITESKKITEMFSKFDDINLQYFNEIINCKDFVEFFKGIKLDLEEEKRKIDVKRETFNRLKF